VKRAQSECLCAESIQRLLGVRYENSVSAVKMWSPGAGSLRTLTNDMYRKVSRVKQNSLEQVSAASALLLTR
jgi:hypothetical protein